MCMLALVFRSAYSTIHRTAEAEVGPIPELTKEHYRLKMRLSPLQHVQTVLIEHLACQFDDPSLLVTAHQFSVGTHKTPDFVLKSNTSSNGFLGKTLKGRNRDEQTQIRLDIREVDTVLEACRQDMIALWNDPTVREICMFYHHSLQLLGALIVRSQYIEETSGWKKGLVCSFPVSLGPHSVPLTEPFSRRVVRLSSGNGLLTQPSAPVASYMRYRVSQAQSTCRAKVRTYARVISYIQMLIAFQRTS
jgi:hypothetical protein